MFDIADTMYDYIDDTSYAYEGLGKSNIIAKVKEIFDGVIDLFRDGIKNLFKKLRFMHNLKRQDKITNRTAQRYVKECKNTVKKIQAAQKQLSRASSMDDMSKTWQKIQPAIDENIDDLEDLKEKATADGANIYSAATAEKEVKELNEYITILTSFEKDTLDILRKTADSRSQRNILKDARLDRDGKPTDGEVNGGWSEKGVSAYIGGGAGLSGKLGALASKVAACCTAAIKLVNRNIKASTTGAPAAANGEKPEALSAPKVEELSKDSWLIDWF